MAKMTYWWRREACGSTRGNVSIAAVLMMSGSSEESGGSRQEDEDHDDENDRAGGLRIENLGEPLDHPEHEAGNDGAEDRPHPPDHDDREDDDDDVDAHQGADLIDRRG